MFNMELYSPFRYASLSIDSFPSVKWLYLNGNELLDEEVELICKLFPKLMSLEIGSISQLVKPMIIHEELVNLYLDKSSVTDETIILCPKLHKLNVSYTSMQAESILKTVKECTNLACIIIDKRQQFPTVDLPQSLRVKVE